MLNVNFKIHTPLLKYYQLVLHRGCEYQIECHIEQLYPKRTPSVKQFGRSATESVEMLCGSIQWANALGIKIIPVEGLR